MARYFILSDDEVVEEPDYQAWARWHATTYEQVREVARTPTAHSVVVTRFLPMTMSLARDASPLVFETRVSGGWLDGQGDRFPAIAEARAGHEAWVAAVRSFEEENQLPPPGVGW